MKAQASAKKPAGKATPAAAKTGSAPAARKPLSITAETTLATILEIPGAEQILEKYHLPCLHCPMSRMEMGVLQLGQVCEMYGISAGDVLRELNQLKR